MGVMLGLLTGCAAQSPSILRPVSPKGRAEADLFGFILAITAFVFIVVEALLLYAVVRFRARDPRAIPPQIHGNRALEVSWTTVTALGLAVIFAMTWRTMAATSTPPADALPVKVIGHQWWWEFQYPTLGITTANELVIPVGQPLRVTVTSADVIHSFWVPQLGGKMDAIPRRENVLCGCRPMRRGPTTGSARSCAAPPTPTCGCGCMRSPGRPSTDGWKPSGLPRLLRRSPWRSRAIRSL